MAAMTSSMLNVCLFIIGKTGHGKSATANSILGSNQFKTSPSTTSVTMSASMASREVDGRTLKVVDTPGLCDTRLNTDESARKAITEFNSGLALCPEGFDALVLVFDYGQRMTEEERDVIKMLKEMLGSDFIRNYAVLVITHGDNFDPEEVEMTFTKWYQLQSGYINDLLQECDNRYVLFDNKTKDKIKITRQRQELLDCVHRLPSRGKRYTKGMFDNARETWEKLCRQQKYAKVTNDVKAVLTDISKDLQVAMKEAKQIDDPFFNRLREKLGSLRGRISNVEQPDKGQMAEQINAMEQRLKAAQIEKQRAAAEAARQEEERKRQELERQRKEHERQRQEQERQFHEMMRRHKKKHKHDDCCMM